MPPSPIALRTQPVYGLPSGLSRASYRQLVLNTPGIALYWRLNELLGTVAHDSIGSHDGTIANAPSLGAAGPILGDPATGIFFTKGSSQTVASSSFVLPSGSVWTLMGWVKAGLLPQAPGLCVHVGSTGNGGGFAVGAANDGSSSGLVWLNSGVGWVNLGYTFPDTSSWHFIAVTGSAGTGQLYVDGAATGGTFGVFTGTPSAGALAGGESTSIRMLTGTLADVAIFTAAVSASQIAALYRLATKGY